MKRKSQRIKKKLHHTLCSAPLYKALVDTDNSHLVQENLAIIDVLKEGLLILIHVINVRKHIVHDVNQTFVKLILLPTKHIVYINIFILKMEISIDIEIYFLWKSSKKQYG